MTSKSIPILHSAKIVSTNEDKKLAKEEHILVSRIIKEMGKNIPFGNQDALEHAIYVNKYQIEVYKLKFLNSRIRLLTAIHIYLHYFATTLLQRDILRNVFKQEALELKENINYIPDENKYKKRLLTSLNELLEHIKTY